MCGRRKARRLPEAATVGLLPLPPALLYCLSAYNNIVMLRVAHSLQANLRHVSVLPQTPLPQALQDSKEPAECDIQEVEVRRGQRLGKGQGAGEAAAAALDRSTGHRVR